MRFCRRLPHHHHCEWLLQRLLLVWGWTRQTSEMWCTGVLRRTWNNMCRAQGGLKETARPLMPILLIGSGLDKRDTEASMQEYSTNKAECRRRLLFRDFDQSADISNQGCACCDICQLKCKCGNCSIQELF